MRHFLSYLRAHDDRGLLTGQALSWALRVTISGVQMIELMKRMLTRGWRFNLAKLTHRRVFG